MNPVRFGVTLFAVGLVFWLTGMYPPMGYTLVTIGWPLASIAWVVERNEGRRS